MMRVLSDTTWSPRKIWNCFDIVNGATPASGTAHFWDGEISWVGPADLGKLSSRVVSRGERNLTESGYKNCGTTFVPAGTIILSARAPIGHVAVAANRLCFNQGCKGLVPNSDIFGEFAYWLILALKPKLEAAGQGTTFVELSRSKLKDVTFLLPPLPEQRAIAAFLDRKCATIDEAVRIKEEQIRLLAERRQILIQQAVTRGLNPDAPMKNSGIDWIGQIPAHWEVKRFKSVATAFGRIGFRGYSTTDLVNKGEGAVTLSPSNLSDGLMQFEKCSYISWKKYQESPEIQVEEGDVLVVKTGSTFGKTGFVRKLPEPATINPQLVVLKNIKCDSEFLYHLISSPQFQAEVKRRVIGSTIPTMSESRLLGIDLQIPPRDEQNEIIDHIAAVSGQIDAVIALKESQITALREYKTSLINAAVTGKIKVL